MIYLISQVTFIFLTQIYHKINFITLSSNSSQDFPGTLRTVFTDCFWRTIFYSPQKMHISEYVCKSCLKELGILLKCKGTLQGILAACNFSEDAGLPQIFLKISDIQYFKNKKEFYHLNYQITGKYLRSKTIFSKKVNIMKIPVQAYMSVKFLEFFIINLFSWCIPLDNEIYFKLKKTF